MKLLEAVIYRIDGSMRHYNLKKRVELSTIKHKSRKWSNIFFSVKVAVANF